MSGTGVSDLGGVGEIRAAELRAGEFVGSAAGFLEFAALYELVPDFGRKGFGRADGYYGWAVARQVRSRAAAGGGIRLVDLQTLLEGFESLIPFFFGRHDVNNS